MEGRMPAEPAQTSKLKPGTTRGVAGTILRWFADIGAAVIKLAGYFLRWTYPAADGTAEEPADSAVTEAEAAVVATENAVAKPTTTTSFTRFVTADVKVRSDDQSRPITHIVLDQQEIQRRRDLVRTLFNEFWSGCDEKPAAFVDRLDEAENYLNERLAACGEFWQLDARTRAMLGLPPRSNSPKKGKTA
jgi:hypothetical protein